MGTAHRQGELWSAAPQGWADVQEPQHRPLWEAMLDAADVGPGTRVLDAGCGAGGACVLAAARGADVSGVDAAQGLVTIARERVPEGDLRVGDLEALPYGDDVVDAVIAASSVQYAGDRVAALRELRRACIPGGRVVVGLFGPPNRVAFAAVFQALRSAMPEPPAGGGPFELSAPGTLESLMADAGLTIVETGETDCPFTYPDVDSFWAGKVAAGPVQQMLRVVPEARLRAAVLDAIRPFVDDDGQIVIGPNVFRWVAATP